MDVPDLLGRLAPGSVAVRRAVANLDLARSIGPVYAWSHYHARRERNKREDDIRNAVYRTIWEEAARSLNAKVVSLGSGLLQISARGVNTRVWQQFVMLDDVVTLRLALDKVLTRDLLVAEGLPVPASCEYDRGTLQRAVDFLEDSNESCVVKPARGTGGGAGIVCGIRTVRDLTRATVWASRASRDLLIERQAKGDVYRFLFLDGRLLDVVHTGAATMTGDGRSTVYELIAAENRRRLAAGGRLGLTILSVDRDCLLTLERADRTLKTVPNANEKVAVKTATNDSCVEDNETVAQNTAPSLIDEAARAARVTGLRLAGVDIITSDLQNSLTAVNGVVIEVNGGPALHRHYHVRDPSRARGVAIPILEQVLHRP